MTEQKSERIDIPALKEAARGRWRDILLAAGLSDRNLNRKHGPCPLCGTGKDRFRFSDREGRGTYICNQCCPDGGDGFALLRGWLRVDFIEACRYVSRFLGGAGVVAGAGLSAAEIEQRQRREAEQQARDWAKVAAQNRAIWQQCQPITAACPAGLYLAQRGLELGEYPRTLRFHPALPYWERNEAGELVKLGEFPAMVAPVLAPDGRALALHKTHLTPDGRKAAVAEVKKMTRASGRLEGAAIRLHAPTHQLAIAEGIETALAVTAANNLPCWAGVSAFGLAHAWLPDSVSEVFVFGDLDASGAGQRAARQLAERMHAQGRTVRIVLPSLPGLDWLDVLTVKHDDWSKPQ
ncbi:DUF7146 domain-containing protein [Chitinilyticum litopenaei]|uniref:DUF7146 domain-containing protein n=1 Tax=Chitinilyticum litopenaei TaxID=1121276 RepID=UPI0003FB0645|nr:toprim domain-containing protein [Chitinilyticum litopenaei]